MIRWGFFLHMAGILREWYTLELEKGAKKWLEPVFSFEFRKDQSLILPELAWNPGSALEEMTQAAFPK